MLPTGKAAGAGFLATSGPASASGTPAMIDGGKVSLIPVLGGLGPAAEALATQDLQGLESLRHLRNRQAHFSSLLEPPAAAIMNQAVGGLESNLY